VRNAYIAEFIAMFGVWLTVVLTYHIMTGGRWRRTPEGRHVMVFGLCFVWVTGLTLANVLFRNYPGRPVVGLVSYASFILVGLQRLFMIIRAQQKRRRELAEAVRQAEAINQP
jgi:hypothetical protein